LNSESGLAKLRGRTIGYIPQEPMSNLDPGYRVGAQLIEPLRLVAGLSRTEAEELILGILQRVGFSDPKRVMSLYPHELSGGMAQRVLIAGALALKPSVIIADEPTTALDVSVQAEVLDLLRSVAAEHNIALIVVTHNLGVVADLASRVYVFQRGAVAECGTVSQVLKHPKAKHTKELLGALLDNAPMRQPYQEHGMNK
jgi:peptide/nickel transport system permease protein